MVQALNHKKSIVFGLLIFLLPALLWARVVLVVSSTLPQYQEVASGFKQSFPGTLEEYNLRGLEDEVRKLGKSLAASPPDLIIVIGNQAAKMAKEYCPNCPVICAAASNAQGIKLSGDLAAGVSAFPSPAKIMENLKLLFPDRRRVGIIYNPSYTGREIQELQGESAKAGFTLRAISINEMKEMPSALSRLIPEIEVYLILDDPGVINTDTFPYIFMNCFQKKVPIFVTRQDMVKNGAIAGFAPDNAKAGAELAQLASQFLSQKTFKNRLVYPEGKLYLNPKIARALNLTFTAQIQNQAVTLE